MVSATILRQARRRAGLTQAELAARCGRAPSAISRWERGDAKPSFETLLELVECAGLQLDYGLRPLDPHDRTLIRRCLAQPPHQRLEEMVTAVRAFAAMARAAGSG